MSLLVSTICCNTINITNLFTVEAIISKSIIITEVTERLECDALAVYNPMCHMAFVVVRGLTVCFVLFMEIMEMGF